MSNLYCRRHQQSWPQGTEVTFGPRDEYGITRLPCCGPSPDQFTVASNFRKAGPSAQAAQAAAESAKLNDTHRKIYSALLEQPRTADEIAAALSLERNTARARCTDLRNAGWIFDTGERGETEAGRPATVWAVSERRAA